MSRKKNSLLHLVGYIIVRWKFAETFSTLDSAAGLITIHGAPAGELSQSRACLPLLCPIIPVVGLAPDASMGMMQMASCDLLQHLAGQTDTALSANCVQMCMQCTDTHLTLMPAGPWKLSGMPRNAGCDVIQAIRPTEDRPSTAEEMTAPPRPALKETVALAEGFIGTT